VKSPIAASAAAWFGKGIVRFLLLMIAAGAIAAFAAGFGIVHDYSYLRASILTGSQGGHYYTLASHLAERAGREKGELKVISTAGSIENVSRLASRDHCAEKFALIQDGTPVPGNARLELLGRLPQPESLLLLGRQGHPFRTFSDLRGASIGIGPENSGTAYLMRQLFEDADLQELNANLSNHELQDQARLVAEGKLDLAAFVMQEDAQFLRNAIRRHGLDVVSPEDLQGLISRYPWLSLGRIPAGRYDLVRSVPLVDKQIAQLATLLVASSCARRADRVAVLTLVAAELPGFTRGNPPSFTSSATEVKLAPSAHQFFLNGEPEIADRYFPWLVNLMSPAYWVYLFMAATVLFNGMKAFSRYRLWRIDAAREKLEIALKGLVDPKLTHAQIRELPTQGMMRGSEIRAAAQAIMDQLRELRARCQRHTNSFVTPMGDEMFYRYQQYMIDEATTTLGALLQRLPSLKGSHERDAAN
jgi:TRAP-type uncharacterized transport system substrate-binding protein